MLPVSEDIRRRQFFMIPDGGPSASRSETSPDLSVPRATLPRSAIVRKSWFSRTVSTPSNAFDPMIDTLRVDALTDARGGNARHSSAPPNSSVSHPSQYSSSTPVLKRQMSENVADLRHTSYKADISAVPAHVKTLRLPNSSPRGDDSFLRQRATCSSSVDWCYASPLPEATRSPEQQKAGRRLTDTSHRDSLSLRSNRDIRLKSKRGRETKLNNKSTSSAGEHVERSSKSSSKLCCAVVLICLLIPLLLLRASQLLPSTNRHELNITTLDSNLHKKVFGQHIALDVINKALGSYLSLQNPRKPLVLSFHGYTGVGKNHVVNVIAEELGPHAVHNIILPLHSARYDDNASRRLTDWVSSNLEDTSASPVMFIVDEISKASPGFLLGLFDLLSNWQDRIHDTSHIVVILLSNTGGTEINQYTYRFLVEGGSRERITHDVVVSHLMTATFRSTWIYKFLSSDLIDHVVPFLPLDRSHVIRCIEAYMSTRRMTVTQYAVDTVLAELRFFPHDRPVFSITGCRQVAGKIDLIAG